MMCAEVPFSALEKDQMKSWDEGIRPTFCKEPVFLQPECRDVNLQL